jgi:hypothetical protein
MMCALDWKIADNFSLQSEHGAGPFPLKSSEKAAHTEDFIPLILFTNGKCSANLARDRGWTADLRALNDDVVT